MDFKKRIAVLQDSHKHLDRRCTDLEKKLNKDLISNELKELKKQKLKLRDQIEELRKLQDEETI